MAVPPLRIRHVNEAPVRSDRSFVLYWMTAYRRTRFNFALQRAVDLAAQLAKPLVILEGLRVDYPWASDRLHRFVIDGMAVNREHADQHGVAYHAYLEPEPKASRGLLEDWAGHACCVVGDDFPAFFLPRMMKAAGSRLDVRLEAVDANGLYPLRDTDRVFARAVDFRRHLQKRLPTILTDTPEPDPLKRRDFPRGFEVPAELTKPWPAVRETLLDGAEGLDGFPIDHAVAAVSEPGGHTAARKRWSEFLERKLSRYGEGRNDPDDEVSSGLSPYLHWGHISTHELFRDLAAREGWSLEKAGSKATGSRSGWWGMSSAAESFLDELVTWRELGLNMAWQRPAYDTYESLPDWAQRTLDAHRSDPRPHIYDLEQFDGAQTHDPIWNAAQRQLKVEGRMHNYLRMLWGKKILEWSNRPEDALEVMIELNNRYALDGRDPNSYSGIFWVLGRYDRAWGPERPIFGKVRYMSSDNTRRKVRLKRYLETHSGQDSLFDP